MNRLIECVPNFSEGRDAAVVEQIESAIGSVAGVLLLDRHMDADHHRSVITFAAPAGCVVEAAVRGVERAAELIDLTRHAGEHPRIGAADVVPFVPLEGVTMEECAALAHQAGQQIWRRSAVPVYFYGAAARSPERVSLARIRRGQFDPDVGGPELHPTAGAVAVGARKLLVAFNVNLDTADVEVARRIARRVRASSGGLAGVQAMGVMLHRRNRAQVSMNVTDFEQTPLEVVFQAVRREAEREGVGIDSSEIVGLAPRRALEGALGNSHPDRVLETRLAEARHQ